MRRAFIVGLAIILLALLPIVLYTTLAAYSSTGDTGTPQATTTLTVDGSTVYQTIEGFGVNANSRSWDLANPDSFTPQLDILRDQVGTQIWRVVVESHEDWEATNDNNDPGVFDTTYYNSLYETAKFQRLWAMLDYLDRKGAQTIYLGVMGCVPSWMGGCTLPDDGSQDDEWVEMIASLVNYARNTKHLRIDLLGPINEQDTDLVTSQEGPRITPSHYVTIMTKLSARLDQLGMGDLRLIGPDLAGADRATAYLNAMASAPELMAKYDHFTVHRYTSGDLGLGSSIAASNYPHLTPWVSEYSGLCANFKCDSGQQVTPSESWQFATDTFDYLLSYLDAGVTGALIWDAYDSYYEHHNTYSYWGLISYNPATQVYTPTTRMYVVRHAYRYIPAGMQRIASTSSNQGLLSVSAFYNSSTGKLTVLGRNKSSSPQSVILNLSAIGTPGTLQLYQTTKSVNWAESVVTPASGAYTFTLAADSMFTLTNVTVDLQPPTVSFTAPAVSATVSGSSVTIAVSASDNVGVAGIQFEIDGANLGAEHSASSPSISWDSTSVANGSHTLGVMVRDAANNLATATRRVVVSNFGPQSYLPLVQR